MNNEPQPDTQYADKVRAVVRRIGYIFLALILAAAGTGVAVRMLDVRSQNKYFVSTTAIVITPAPIEFTNHPAKPGTTIRLPDYAAELKKQSILNAVIEKLNLTHRLGTPERPVNNAEAAAILERTVFVKPKQFVAFEVSVFGKDRSLTAEIANAVPAAYAAERSKTGGIDAKTSLLAEMRSDLDSQKAKVGRLYETAAKLRRDYAIEDPDPESTNAFVSTSSNTDSVEKKFKNNEYIEAKSEYLMAKSLMLVIEQRHAAAKLDNTIVPPPVQILQRASPDLSATPSHLLPDETPRAFASAMQLCLVALGGMAAGVGIAFMLLRELVSRNDRNPA